MDLDFLARLRDLVERSKVAELDLTLDGARLRVVKAHGAAASSATPWSPASVLPQGTAAQGPPTAAPPAPASQPSPRKLHAVKAGFPGTFYRAPAPGAAPFVSAGDAVEDGRQLAIVEAMKTMNPVEADIAGTVLRIAAEDGQAVETGDLLFEIEPHG